jgi:exodeoxyribonuclease VII small subunit
MIASEEYGTRNMEPGWIRGTDGLPLFRVPCSLFHSAAKLKVMAAPKSKQPPFEELYKELEEKVSLLEQGGLSLDDSLAAYEDAVALAKSCQQLLDTAELRITRLRAVIPAAEEELSPEDEMLFDSEDDLPPN